LSAIKNQILVCSFFYINTSKYQLAKHVHAKFHADGLRQNFQKFQEKSGIFQEILKRISKISNFHHEENTLL
jgi:hypothetical protein